MMEVLPSSENLNPFPGPLVSTRAQVSFHFKISRVPFTRGVGPYLREPLASSAIAAEI